MASTNRVPQQGIVKPAPVVLAKKSLDAIFTKDNPNIVFTDEFGNVIGDVPVGAFNFIGGNGSFSTGTGVSGSSGPSGVTAPIITPPDVPSLADIESITYEEYADTNGVAKYKAVIKIRNSSTDKLNVLGVDARIYNTSGSSTYTLGSGNASSGATGSNASAFTSNATWYKAVASYNPFEGSVVSAPAISTNAQYLADGSNVPKDLIVGISTNIKTAEAWRKTENDALTAVTALYSKYIV